jgi:hypothetical protein
MQRNGLEPIQSSFLSCEKDVEIILNRLFVESGKYSNWLKRLLIINTPDCLDPKITKYDDIVNKYSVKDLMQKDYIRQTPRLEFNEHNDVQSYILLSFDNFTTNSANNRFRDCMVNFDILCHTKQWEMEDFRVRPLMIAGYIDGILNLKKLSGVGQFVFLGCNELILDSNLAGYTLSYEAVHFTEDDAKLEELSSK